MKKKLMALCLALVMVFSLTSTAFAADVKVEATAGGLVDQIKKSVDWFAGDLYTTNAGMTKQYTVTQYHSIFLIGSSGVETDNTKKVNTQFVEALKSELTTNNGMLIATPADTKTGSPAVEFNPLGYTGVIAALTVMGENPESVGGFNLFSILNTSLSTSWGSGDVDLGSGSPYRLDTFIAVLKKYSAKVENASDWLKKAYECAEGFYFADGKDDTAFVTDETVKASGTSLPASAVFSNGMSAFDGFTVDTDYFNYGGFLVINSSSAKKDDLVAALSSKVTGGRKIVIDKWDDITVTAHIDGKGIYWWGFQADNDATFCTFLSDNAGSKTIVSALKSCLNEYMAADGSVKGFGGDLNADSTGLTLAAESIMGDKETAEKNYAGLSKFYNENTGAFVNGAGEDNLYATMDALKGIISYYRLLTGAENIFTFAKVTLEEIKGADQDAYAMTDKDGNSATQFKYSTSKKEGVTFRSMAPLGEFLALYIGGNKVDPQFYTLAEGSTLVTVSTDYLDTLDKGDYEVKIQSLNGYALATLTVDTTKSPQTGDNMPLVLLISALALSGITLFELKKRYNR